MDSANKIQGCQYSDQATQPDLRYNKLNIRVNQESSLLYWQKGLVAMLLIPITSLSFIVYSQYKYPEFILDNPWINGAILSVFGFGQIYFLYQFNTIRVSQNYFINITNNVKGLLKNKSRMPEIISHAINTLNDLEKIKDANKIRRRNPEQIVSYIIDGIISRIDNQRQLPKYIVSSLFLLGLVGTFIGLLSTVVGVADVIENLSWQGNDLASALGKLNNSLSIPVSGMKTAFSSSIIGMGGGLISGMSVLILQLAQNRLVHIIEYQLVSKDTIVKVLGSSNYIENSEKEVSKLSVEILKLLVLNNSKTINKMEELNEKQHSWFANQLANNSPLLESIHKNLIKRIDMVENILVKLVESIHKVTSNLPNKLQDTEINKYNSPTEISKNGNDKDNVKKDTTLIEN